MIPDPYKSNSGDTLSWTFFTLKEAEAALAHHLPKYGGQALIKHLEPDVAGWQGAEVYKLIIKPARPDVGLVFHGVIMGSYVSMKNGRRIVRLGKRVASIKKEKALTWEELAMYQIRYKGLPYEGPLALCADFYYDNVQADLDENLLKDMLQKKKPGKPCLGIIKNDNQIKKHDTEWHLDKLNPRVEFSLIKLDAYKKSRFE